MDGRGSRRHRRERQRRAVPAGVRAAGAVPVPLCVPDRRAARGRRGAANYGTGRGPVPGHLGKDGHMIADAPSHVDVPAPVADLIDGRPYRPVWRSELGSLTFEVTTADGREFLKWTPVGSGLDVSREAARLAWAGAYVPVPR